MKSHPETLGMSTTTKLSVRTWMFGRDCSKFGVQTRKANFMHLRELANCPLLAVPCLLIDLIYTSYIWQESMILTFLKN